MTVRRFLMIGCFSIGALHAPAPASGQERGSLDGKWAGRTSQGRPIGFRIEAGTMRTLEVDWTLKYDDVCPAGSASLSQTGSAETFFFHPHTPGYEPPPIRFPSFTVSREVGTPKAPVTMVLTGSFGSDSTVAGDMALTAPGCQGRETITWKAGRKTGRSAADQSDDAVHMASASPRGSP